MGASASVAIQEQEARKRSKSIDDTIAQDRARDAKTVKILMLGPCDAGKSTLAKQVRLIHDKGFWDKEKAQYRHVVRANLCSCVLSVLQAMDSNHQPFPDPDLAALADRVKGRLQGEEGVNHLMEMTSELHVLMADRHVHRFLDTYSNAGLTDSALYFFKSWERILSPCYVPTDYDILRARQRSLGLAETVFHFRGFHIRLCDVDGSSVVKKKWLQCFENVSAVLFTVAMDTYDVRVREGDERTALEDALQAFGVVCSHEGFSNTAVVLFLNKKDVLKTKLKLSPLSNFMPGYTGGSDCGEAIQFLQDTFRQRAADKPKLFMHVTCAIDTGSVRSVFDSVLASVLQSPSPTPPSPKTDPHLY